MLSMKQDQSERRAFTWRGYTSALAFAAVVLFVVGVALDAMLRATGIGISIWFDAFWSAVVGFGASFFVARMFWRLGLKTLPQYMIGAFAVMAPISILSFIPLTQIFGAAITVPWITDDASPHHAVAMTVYIRFARAVILVPIFLAAFYWFYHIRLRMEPDV